MWTPAPDGLGRATKGRESMDILQLLGISRDEIMAKIAPMIAEEFASPHAYEIGANYLIRTATMIDTGRLVAVTKNEIVLADAAWIADTGRFADSLKTCEFAEVEPFINEVIIGRGAIIDATTIPMLPRAQK
jgi:hypothetical protein